MAELRVKGTGTIKLFENDNTSNVTIASPASLGADRTITLPDASVTLASGTMLATDGSGARLTALNASELGSGTVPTARLGSGTASSSTVLYGDQTYKAEPGGGKILQVQSVKFGSGVTSITSDTLSSTEITDQITPSSTDSDILVMINASLAMSEGSGSGIKFKAGLYRQIGGGGFSLIYAGQGNQYGGVGQNDTWTSISGGFPTSLIYVDSPATTSAVDYTLYIALNTASGQGDNVNTGASDMERSVTLMEIDGS